VAKEADVLRSYTELFQIKIDVTEGQYRDHPRTSHRRTPRSVRHGVNDVVHTETVRVIGGVASVQTLG
jgi:hypothetical protein